MPEFLFYFSGLVKLLPQKMTLPLNFFSQATFLPPALAPSFPSFSFSFIFLGFFWDLIGSLKLERGSPFKNQNSQIGVIAMWNWQNCQTGEIAKWTWEKAEVNVAKYPSEGYSIAEPFHNENFVFLFLFLLVHGGHVGVAKSGQPPCPKRKGKEKQKLKKRKSSILSCFTCGSGLGFRV
jgi:hypothetical protein